MRRREFITRLSAAAAAWPLAARAQQPTATTHRLGLLFLTQRTNARGLLEAVTQGLKEYGWVEGQNITIEYRFADGKADALPKLAVEVVQLRVDAIVTDSTPATQAAENATRTVPIVAIINDPVASGFVVRLARPGGNITGVGLQSAELAGRRIQLLTELVPGLARVAIFQSGKSEPRRVSQAIPSRSSIPGH
jgi:putative tryptophan/tyrosine transport system substrate-binding protein